MVAGSEPRRKVCSSAPCGNATIRKWAKSTREVFRPELGDGPPPEAHGPFHVTAPGQVALLGKRRPAAARSGDDGPEPLDGPSGKAAGGAPSLVSRRRLLDRYLALSPEGDEALSYEAHKRRADDARRRARDDALRFGPRAPFAAWLCSRPPLA